MDRITLLFVAAMVAVGSVAGAAPVVVSGATSGWSYSDGAGWTHAFVIGPAGQPLGTGSLNFVENGGDASDAGQAIYNGLDGTKLADLTTLSYSTYVAQWNGQQAPWVRIFVDLNGDGSTDENLAFEPDFQFVNAGDTSPAAATGMWQLWNTMDTHGWYADDGLVYTFAEPGDIQTGNFADYVALHPNALVATDHMDGSFRIRSGFTGIGDNFDTNIDNVTINGTTFDFDPDASALVAVPLPRSAWAGLVLMGVLGVVRARRRARAA